MGLGDVLCLLVEESPSGNSLSAPAVFPRVARGTGASTFEPYCTGGPWGPGLYQACPGVGVSCSSVQRRWSEDGSSLSASLVTWGSL